MGGKLRLALLGAVSLLGAACSVPVAVDLPESEANRIVVALEDQGVVAEKELDPKAEGHWRVSVGRDDASAAVSVLRRESLPTRASPGVLESLGEGSLVPSRTAEHAKLISGTAGDLERSLRQVDGVLSARVHLAVPAKDPLMLAGSDTEGPKATASVLLRYRGATSPLPAPEVQRLVAGAVPELDADQVAVVLDQVADPPRPPERQLARFGPVTATRSSMTPLRLIVGAGALVNVVLIALLLWLWARTRGLRGELDEVKATLGDGEASR